MGLIAAIAAALCEIQGFVAWPVGLICLLWPTSRTRRTYYELAIWVSTAALTTALYLVGFSFHNNSCSVEGGQQGLRRRYAVVHPVQLGRFVVVLIGNVVPVSLSAVPARYLLVFELLGSAIILSAVYVVVQSIRDRRRGVNPLPLVLIVFAFLFDLMVAASHLGEGPTAAGLNRFTMPNLILLTGIAVYACVDAPTLRKLREPVSRRDRLRTLEFAVLLALLVAQCVLATRFGITQGTVMRGGGETIGRVVVNLDRVPHAKRACYFESQVVGPPLYELQAVLGIAERNHLSVFQNSTSRHFRDMGPPILQQCVFGAGIASALLPQGLSDDHIRRLSRRAEVVHRLGGRWRPWWDPYRQACRSTYPPASSLVRRRFRGSSTSQSRCATVRSPRRGRQVLPFILMLFRSSSRPIDRPTLPFGARMLIPVCLRPSGRRRQWHPVPMSQRALHGVRSYNLANEIAQAPRW